MYQWYKTLEVGTPILEFGLTCLVMGYLSLYQRPEQQPNFVHRILRILLVSDLLVMVVLLWQSLDTA